MHIPRTIYAIRHNVTGRVYVGSSAAPIKRIRSHLNALRRGKHNNSALNRPTGSQGYFIIPPGQKQGGIFGMDIKIKLPGGEIHIHREKKERDWFPFWMALGVAAFLGTLLLTLYILR